MQRTLLTLMLCLFITLTACGREGPEPTAPGNALRVEPGKSSKADEAPRVADPLKEGY